MEIELTETAVSDIKYWKKSGQKNIINKIDVLIKDIIKNPETGIGHPEPLKFNFSGCCSRKIDKKNRIIYQIDEDNNRVIIHSLKGHYSK